MGGYLTDNIKYKCFGCEACASACSQKAIALVEDEEGFRYPRIDMTKCVNCGLCQKVCPYEEMPDRFENEKLAFGGYHNNAKVRNNSTSGGAFTAVAEAFCEKSINDGVEYVIFGAEAQGIDVFHTFITNIDHIDRLRKSKYSQSRIGTSFSDCKQFLANGKRVLFSGTPCQIAGLKAFLRNRSYDNLLTVEVICEGVPSPHYIRKYRQDLIEKQNSDIKDLDYRFTNSRSESNPTRGKWDFEVMKTTLKNGKTIRQDRWFNPFWSIWLNHLMSRPSCYSCPFTNTARVADISLGDLWGVHLYCPELYGKNMGSSLVVFNTDKASL